MASNKPEKIDNQIIKIRRKISLPCTNNRNIHFFNLQKMQGLLFGYWVRLQYPKTIPTFILYSVPTIRRILILQHKLSHRNHSVYRWTTTTAPQHNTTEILLQLYKNNIKMLVNIFRGEQKVSELQELRGMQSKDKEIEYT